MESLQSDVTELTTLLAQAKSARVRKLLSAALNDLKTQLQQKEKEQSTNGTTPSTKPSVDINTNSAAAVTKLTTYAWDQSDKFIKIYVNSPVGEDVVKDSHVKFECTDNVDLSLNDVEGKNYQFTIRGFLHAIDTENSKFKVKKDSVLLMLKKVKERTSWEHMTKHENKSVNAKKEELKGEDKDNADPQASMMRMMKQMYDDGDDKMKQTIKKSMFEAQNKKGGAGDMGMGGMMGM